jgi:hypothetical protein
VKYHCLEHLDVKFLEKFYKKVIYNEYSSDTPESYKASLQNPIVQVEPKVPKDVSQAKPEEKVRVQVVVTEVKKRGRKKGFRLKKKT